MDYNIGIIDDDVTKITQLLTFIKLGWSDKYGNLMKEKYRDVNLIPKSISLVYDIQEMVNQIRQTKPDALIIDYKLSSQQNISYSGVDLAKQIDNILKEFPIFILTSYQDDLYTKEIFDVYQVFDFERYISDDQERLEINSKIVEQICNYNKRLISYKEELLKLIPQAGVSAEIDQRILALDTVIEKSINGVSALSEKTKNELSASHIQTLIDKIDRIIKEG